MFDDAGALQAKNVVNQHLWTTRKPCFDLYQKAVLAKEQIVYDEGRFRVRPERS